MSNPDVINPEPDLTDPQTLAHLLEAVAPGLRQESEAKKRTSCMAGHPNPSDFFNRVAKLVEAAAAMIRPKKDEKKEEKPVAPPTKDATKDAAKDKVKLPVPTPVG